MSIPFSINTTNKGLWRTLSNNEYEDCMQPLVELIDNSIAANSTLIKITIDFDKTRGSIEDNGQGFPCDPDGLSRCFTYSPDVRFQTDLNEHGCGLKSSLAILDPHDKDWRITWKCAGKIYKVEAPYARPNHSAVEIDTWPGSIEDSTGVLIEFPIHKERFDSLYSNKSTSKANIIPKLKNELSQYWMKHIRVVGNVVKMYLNEEHVVPFIVPCEDTNFIKSVRNFSCKLSSGASVDGSHYLLADETSKNRDSWFKKAVTHNGILIFKNGRIIQRVTSGKLYKLLTKLEASSNYNGNIAVINVHSKDPTSLPVTVPTKNKFKPTNNPLFDELIEIVQKQVTFILTNGMAEESEESLLKKFQKTRANNFASEDNISYTFLLKEQLNFKEDNLNSPQIDAIEIIDKKAIVYEAKKKNMVSLEHIIQLYSNWILSIDAIKEQYSEVEKVIPVLIINFDTEQEKYNFPEGLKIKIKKLHENSKSGFPMEVRNFKNAEIFKFKV